MGENSWLLNETATSITFVLLHSLFQYISFNVLRSDIFKQRWSCFSSGNWNFDHSQVFCHINPSNAEANFAQSTRMQGFLLLNPLNPITMVLIGKLSLSTLI